MRKWAPNSFVTQYLERSHEVESFLCVGLDPTEKHIPPSYGDPNDLETWWRFLSDVIDLSAKYAAVCKPQSAYYERVMRRGGMDLLFKVVSRIRELEIMSILDAKRGDIGPTDSCYADWIVGEPDNGIGYGFGACTRQPYLGGTFLPNTKGVFDLEAKDKNWWPYMKIGKMPILMCRTSNGEAPWLQNQMLPNGQLVYQWVASEIARMDALVAGETDGTACIGAVVGATYPSEAVECRALAPDVLFLIPGYGAQGGGAADAVAGFPVNGRLLGTVNSSRGITQAWMNKDGSPKDGDPLMHVELAMIRARDELNEALTAKIGFNPYHPPVFVRPSQKIVIVPSRPSNERYLQVLRECGGYYNTPMKDGEALGPLVGYSGKYEDETGWHQYVGFRYFNLAKLEENPHAEELFAHDLAQVILDQLEGIDCIVGVPTGGSILGHNVARHLDAMYVGLEKKVITPGTESSKEVIKLVFGRHGIEPGMRCVLDEDLCNNFSTSDLAIAAVENAGGQVVGIICGMNRSDTTEFKGLPVVTLVHLPTPQYKQSDPEVAAFIEKPGVVWNVKPEWAHLEKAMTDAQAEGVPIV